MEETVDICSLDVNMDILEVGLCIIARVMAGHQATLMQKRCFLVHWSSRDPLRKGVCTFKDPETPVRTGMVLPASFQDIPSSVL